MPKHRSWTDEELIIAVRESRSIRMVLQKLHLVPAGGNYAQVNRRIVSLQIDTKHFLGKGWNVGLKFNPKPRRKLEELLIENGTTQSYKLKSRLFESGLKKPVCELCGWAELTTDGRIPVELDHINGNNCDNRLANLRILCPNCHSLQLTHRGKNKKVRLKLQ